MGRMMLQDSGQASAESEVSPAMINAGATALFCGGYEPGDNDRDVAVRVYQAMESARLAQELTEHGSLNKDRNRQARAEPRISLAMVRAFQGAYLKWENGSKGWSYSVGLEQIPSALLRKAPEDMQSLVCPGQHTDHTSGVSPCESAKR
jgi:hypothetical protein